MNKILTAAEAKEINKNFFAKLLENEGNNDLYTTILEHCNESIEKEANKGNYSTIVNVAREMGYPYQFSKCFEKDDYTKHEVLSAVIFKLKELGYKLEREDSYFLHISW